MPHGIPSQTSGLTVWGTVLPFAIPDKDAPSVMMYHLAAAGFTGVVLPVPPWPYTAMSGSSLRDTLEPWVRAAQEVGLGVILEVGPTYELGIPWHGVPPVWWALSTDERQRTLQAWWECLVRLPHDGVVYRMRTPFLDIHDWAPVFWQGHPAWAIDEWPLVDVTELTWQEWETDALWWARLDHLPSDSPVRVRFWWENVSGPDVPTPEVVHERVGPGWVATVLVTLWARGIRHVWWDPVRTGVLWGVEPPETRQSSLDGGAPFRSWGQPTATWRRLRQVLQQAHALRVGHLTWHTAGSDPDSTDVLARGRGRGEEIWAWRFLGEGERTLSLSGVISMEVIGPDAGFVPVGCRLSLVGGAIRIVNMPITWHEITNQREIWITNTQAGGNWEVELDAQLVYYTSTTIHREDNHWRVTFHPGQPGQVLWRSKHGELHLIGVNEHMAARVWPRGLDDTLPLFMGPNQVLSHQVDNTHQHRLRVSVDTPTAFVAVDQAPWRMRALETAKEAVWGERSGIGGLPLPGPKEWGAPRVTLPALQWHSIPWEGPFTPWGWVSFQESRGTYLTPGWHWFRTRLPSYCREIILDVQGVVDVWVRGQRVAGLRAVEERHQRQVALPQELGEAELAVVIWVPPPLHSASLSTAGYWQVHVPIEEPLQWQYRRGMPGWHTEERGHQKFATIIDHASPAEDEGIAFWCHTTSVVLDLPSGVWTQLGLSLGDLGELAWLFVNGVLVGRWWAGRSRENALWLPPEVLNYQGENTLTLFHWPRGRSDIDLTSVTLVQLVRERISTVELTR